MGISRTVYGFSGFADVLYISPLGSTKLKPHTAHTHKWDGLYTRGTYSRVHTQTHTNTNTHAVHIIPRAKALTPQHTQNSQHTSLHYLAW